MDGLVDDDDDVEEAARILTPTGITSCCVSYKFITPHPYNLFQLFTDRGALGFYHNFTMPQSTVQLYVIL